MLYHCKRTSRFRFCIDHLSLCQVPPTRICTVKLRTQFSEVQGLTRHGSIPSEEQCVWGCLLPSTVPSSREVQRLSFRSCLGKQEVHVCSESFPLPGPHMLSPHSATPLEPCSLFLWLLLSLISSTTQHFPPQTQKTPFHLFLKTL